MSFKDYYKSFSDLQGDLKRRVCEKLEISDKTFYNKLNADAFTEIEREAIDAVIDDFKVELQSII